MRDYKKEYARGKGRARAEAIEWIINDSNYPYSYGGLAILAEHFGAKSRRYGLIKEFRENGIPC